MMPRLISLLFLLSISGFGSAQTKLTEADKIKFLLSYIEKLDAVFLRNNQEYKPSEAVSHLAFKLEKSGGKVKSAKDFIDYIASKSSITGEPYRVKFTNGSILNLRDLLYNQLKKLETQ